jgi:two-component system, OmpR family, phosphate regulon response regulator PhoB
VTDRPTVLVVDDGPDLRLLCRLNLEFEGYRVLEAGSAAEARDRLAEEVPDLVLLEVALPDDGWSLLEELTAGARTREVPVVIVTERSHGHDQLRAWSAGATEYVTKPFSSRGLSHLVRDVLETTPEERRRRRQLAEAQLALLLGEHPDDALPPPDRSGDGQRPGTG